VWRGLGDPLWMMQHAQTGVVFPRLYSKPKPPTLTFLLSQCGHLSPQRCRLRCSLTLQKSTQNLLRNSSPQGRLLVAGAGDSH
jgi:hypothetical protein